jgi:hypothetical protein
MTMLSTDSDTSSVRRSVLRIAGAVSVGFTVATVVGALTGSAVAEAPTGTDWSQRQPHSTWQWNFYRPGVLYSAPPVIYPALGYATHPGQQPEVPPDNVRFTLPRH